MSSSHTPAPNDTPVLDKPPAPASNVTPVVEGEAQVTSTEKLVEGGVTERTIELSDSRIRRMAPSAPDPRDAQGTPFGRYRLLQELGRGGMGIVWKTWDTQLRRVVALKQILSEGGFTAAQAARFVREARLAARLRHPNIVGVLDVGECEGKPYFTTDYIEGSALDVVIKSPVAPKQAVAWARAVAEALGYAHEQGVVHRDVKPANILIDSEGRPFVMDFGLAKEVDLGEALGSAGPALTISGALVGTPQYMSPEQARGQSERLGPASDQFSLGVVLYQMLTGRTPFDGQGLRDLLNAISESEPIPPSRLNPRLHRDVETICLKALEKDPSRRYRTATEMAKDLGRYLDGEPIEARPLGAAGRLARSAYKNRWVVLPSVAAILVALAAGGYLVVQRHLLRAALDAALSLGRQSEARGDMKGARDAYKRAADLDASCAEAAAGAARAGAALDHREREADEARRRALAKEALAEEALRKARLVQGVFARWGSLSETLTHMERVWSDSTLAPEEVRRRNAGGWKKIEEFLQETPEDPTSRATALALGGWGRRLAGTEEEGRKLFAESRRLDPDLPFAALVEALELLDRIFLTGYDPITIDSPGAQLICMLPAEPPSLRALRGRLDECLKDATGAHVWGEETASDLRGVVEAFRALKEGRVTEADEGLSRALTCPSLFMFHTTLLSMRAKVRALMGRPGEALKDVDRVLEARPEDAQVHYTRGYLLHAIATAKARQGGDAAADLRAAETELGEAIRRQPDAPQGYTMRGMVRLALKDETGAIEDYDRALRWNPRDLSTLVDRGVLRDARGDLDGAIADYGLALEIEPKLVLVRVNRGAAWMRKGALDRAMAEFDEALRLRPDVPNVYHGRAELRKKQGDLAGAEREYDAEIRALPMYAEARRLRGLLRLERKNVDGAIEDFTQGLAIDPANLSCLFCRAKARRAKEDVAGAISDLDEALKTVPDNADVLFERGLLHQGRGETDAAISDFDATIRSNPKIAEAWADRAILRRGRGDAKGALADDDEALRLDPSRADVWCNRGNVRGDLGDAGGAEEDYGEALRLDAHHLKARLLRANVRAQRGNTDGAMSDLQEVLKDAPADWPLRPSAEELARRLRGK